MEQAVRDVLAEYDARHDAQQSLSIPCFERLHPKPTDLDSISLPIGSGIELSRKRG